jgi:hypothetical protein
MGFGTLVCGVIWALDYYCSHIRTNVKGKLVGYANFFYLTYENILFYSAAMPKSGDKYATVEVDLQRWLLEEMQRTGKKQAAMARHLDVERARVHEMKNGKLNTMQFLEIIVEKVYKGDFTAMAKFAQTDTGLQMLKDLNFKKSLNPQQRDVYSRIDELVKKKILKDMEDAEDLLKSLEE